MKYYLQTGDICTTKMADSHKQAALDLLDESSHYDVGVFIIVCRSKISDQNHQSHMYFSTQALIEELEERNINNNCQMRLVE